MELQQTLATLERIIQILEEELTGKRQLLDALHPAVSFALRKELEEQIESINRSIGYNRANIDQITESMKSQRANT